MLLYKAAAIDLLPGFRLHIACAQSWSVMNRYMPLAEYHMDCPRTCKGKLFCYVVKSFYFTFCWRLREDYEDTIWLLKGKAKKIHNGPSKHSSLTCCPSSVFFVSMFQPVHKFVPFKHTPISSKSVCVCERESRHAESIWRVMSSDRKSFVWRLPRRFMAIYALLLHTHTHTHSGGHS